MSSFYHIFALPASLLCGIAFTYNNNGVDIFSKLDTAVANAIIDPTEHTWSVVINASWANADVKFVYADGTAVPAGALTGEPDELAIGTAADLKIHYDVADDADYVADGQLTYKVEGAAKGTEDTKLEGKLTNDTATTISVKAEGGKFVTVTIGGVKKADTGNTDADTYTVDANATYTGKVKFAVVKGKTAAQVTSVPADANWSNSVTAEVGDVILIKSAKDGVKLSAATLKYVNTTTSDITANTDVGGSSGVLKEAMVAGDLRLVGATDNEPSISKMSIAPDATQVNVLMANSNTYEANDTQSAKYVKAAAVVAYITENSATLGGWSAEVNPDGFEAGTGKAEADGIILKKGNQQQIVDDDTLAIGDSLPVVTIDGTAYVMNAALGTVTVPDALAVAGKTITGAKEHLYIIANKNNVGTYTNGANIVGVATGGSGYAASTVASGVKEILTNNGKGYAKLDSTTNGVTAAVTAGSATDFKSGGVAEGPTAALKNASSYLADASNVYAPIGVDMTITLTFTKPDAKGKLTKDATAAIAGTNLTLSKYTAATAVPELVKDAEFVKTDTVDLTFQISGVGSAAAGSLTVTLADKV